MRRLSVPLFLAGLGFGAAAAQAPPTPPPEPVFGAVLPAEPQPAPALPPTPPPAFVPPETVQGLPPVAEPDFEMPPTIMKTSGRYTMIAGHGDELGLDVFEVDAMVAAVEIDTPGQMRKLTVTPAFGVTFVDGPNRTDLPPRLYSTQVEFRWFSQLGMQYAYEIAVTPSLFTDGDNTGSDAFRLPARALGFMFLSERTQVAAGLVYLDREDIGFLPAVGLIHSPNDETKIELVFPKPRLLRRVGVDSDGETWAYLGGEFGGGSWAIERRNGRDDVATYGDYRALVGLEFRSLAGDGRPAPNRWTAAVEAGYVFGRELEYKSNLGNYDPDDTFLLRLALSR